MKTPEERRHQSNKIAREYAKGRGYMYRVITSMRKRAAEKGLPYDDTIDAEYLHSIMPTHCPVLGIELVRGDGHSIPASPSIDRIVPEKGYVKGNIMFISKRANQIKSDASVVELKLVAEYYDKYFSTLLE